MSVEFIHSVFCLKIGPKHLPKRCFHIVRSRVSSFKWEYPLLSLRSSSSFLRLLPRLLATNISPYIFPSITCFRRQFLRTIWPIQLAFRFLISYRIFLCSVTLSNTSSFLTWSVQLIFSILLQHHISKLSRYFWSAARSVQSDLNLRKKLIKCYIWNLYIYIHIYLPNNPATIVIYKRWMRSHHLHDISAHRTPHSLGYTKKPEDGQNRPKHVVFIHCTYSTIN